MMRLFLGTKSDTYFKMKITIKDENGKTYTYNFEKVRKNYKFNEIEFIGKLIEHVTKPTDNEIH